MPAKGTHAYLIDELVARMPTPQEVMTAGRRLERGARSLPTKYPDVVDRQSLGR